MSETAPVMQRSERGGEVLRPRPFAKSRRALIPADRFYEFTTPAGPTQKRKDKWRFTTAGER